MSFRRKSYPEISEHLLNRLFGGVSGEAHPYPPANGREPYSHALLSGPATQISSAYGLVNGVSTAFSPGVDYELGSNGKSLNWKKDGQRPDAGSVLEINYLPRQRNSRINDLYPGSVVRTLLEAVALETASLYAQMETVYRSGFIDTAEGRALDHVVALLDIQRYQAGRNSATVEFSRTRNSRGEIVIPAGTRVLTEDGDIEYETLHELILSDGQATGRVTARDRLATNDSVAANTLVLLAKAFVGIESVTNPDPSSRLDRDEADAELRSRAKSVLVGSERGTLGAIETTIIRHGLLADIDDSTPGLIKVMVHDNQLSIEQKSRLEADLRAVKPAGVALADIIYGPQPQAVDLEIRLTTAPGLAETDLKHIQSEVRSRIADYFAKLPTKSVGSISKLIGLSMAVAGVEDVAIVTAKVSATDVLVPAKGELAIAGQPTRLGQLNLVDSALASQLTLRVHYSNNVAIPDQTAMQMALQEVVSQLNIQADKTDTTAEQRILAWSKLALLTPLPGFAAPTFKEYSSNPALFALPTAAQRTPYELTFLFSRPNGVSQIVDNETAAAFVLAAYERLSLLQVAVQVKPKGSGP